MPPKDIQTVAKESLDRYRQRQREDRQPKQGTPIDLTQPQCAYKLQSASRFYADAELSIVFKESNAKLLGRRLFQFTDRVWVYATNAHIRAMCANLQRVVFKTHTGAVTDVVLPTLSDPSKLVVGSCDVNKRVCIWSVNDKEVTTATHVNCELSGTAYGIYMNLVATGTTTLKVFLLLSNGQVSLYDIQQDVWALDNAPSLGVLSVVMDSTTLPREICVTDTMVVASCGDRITGTFIAKFKPSAFEIQTTSKSGNVTFLHVLSPTTIVVATMTSLQLWSLSPEPFLSQVIQVDLRNYRLKGYTPNGTQNTWCVVACPLEWSTTTASPLLCFHIAPSASRFVIDYVSEFDLICPVVAFQVSASAQSPTGIDVYVMHSNYLVLMKLGARALLNVPQTPSTEIESPPTSVAAPAPYRTTTNTSGSYEDKVARLKAILAMQQDQISSLVDQVASQAETVRALSSEMNRSQLPISLENFLVKIEKKIFDLKGKVGGGGNDGGGNDSAKIKKLSDDVVTIITSAIPKILNEALVKVCTKDTTKLAPGVSQQIISDIMTVSKQAIQAAVTDATQELLRTVGQESVGLTAELIRWRQDIQTSLQRTHQTIATAQVSSTPQATPSAELVYSPEVVAEMVQQRQFSDAIKLTVKTRKFEDMSVLLNILSHSSGHDIEALLNSGEISLDAVIAMLTSLSSDLKDSATVDLRVEWIEAVGMSDAFLTKKPEAKAAWELCGERLTEVRAWEGYSAKTLRCIKRALGLFR